MMNFLVDYKSIENDVIQIHSLSMSDDPTRIRLFPTLIYKIKWFRFELPLTLEQSAPIPSIPKVQSLIRPIIRGRRMSHILWVIGYDSYRRKIYLFDHFILILDKQLDTFDWGFCSFWNDCDASWKGEILDEAQFLGHSSGTLNHIRNNLGFIFLFNFLFYPTFKLALFCPLERCGHSHWSIQPTLNLEFSTPRTENRHIYSSPIQYNLSFIARS